MYKVASACPFSAGIISSFSFQRSHTQSYDSWTLGRKRHIYFTQFFFSILVLSLSCMAWFITLDSFPSLHPVPCPCCLSEESVTEEVKAKVPPRWQHEDESKSWDSRPVSTDPASFSVISHFSPCASGAFSHTSMLSHASVFLYMHIFLFFPSHHVRPTLTYGSEGLYFKAYLQTSHCVSVCRSHYSFKGPASLFC